MAVFREAKIGEVLTADDWACLTPEGAVKRLGTARRAYEALTTLSAQTGAITVDHVRLRHELRRLAGISSRNDIVQSCRLGGAETIQIRTEAT